MDLATFIEKRRPTWRQLEEVLQRVEGSGLAGLDDDQAVEFGRLYRGTASDLNQAQTFVRGDAVVEYLNGLVARSYAVIYAKERPDLWKMVRHFLWGYPAIFRRYIGHFLLATVLLSGGTLFGALAAIFDEHAAESFLMPAGFSTIRPKQDGPLMGSGQLAGFSSHLFTNNTQVTLVAFALGMTFGLGTAWLMWFNGILMGVLGVIFYRAGAFMEFCTGILPHGVLEIPAILIGGAAGFVLAQGMIRARPWSRVDELARCGKEAFLLVSGAVPLLVLAALLEAGVARAPSWFFDQWFKLMVAAVFGSLFVAYIVALGWSRDDLRSTLLGRLLKSSQKPGRLGV
jgi:uncharacterized membrane protein SpoIIM required for sporulation